jgi:hypothetical protein
VLVVEDDRRIAKGRLPLITSPIPTSSISAAPAWPPFNSGAAVGIVVDAGPVILKMPAAGMLAVMK